MNAVFLENIFWTCEAGFVSGVNIGESLELADTELQISSVSGFSWRELELHENISDWPSATEGFVPAIGGSRTNIKTEITVSDKFSSLSGGCFPRSPFSRALSEVSGGDFISLNWIC